MDYNQTKVILRLVVGGYLSYLAYDLFRSNQGNWVFLAASLVFALAGAGLVIHSLLTLVRSDYFRNPPPETKEESEES